MLALQPGRPASFDHDADRRVVYSSSHVTERLSVSACLYHTATTAAILKFLQTKLTPTSGVNDVHVYHGRVGTKGVIYTPPGWFTATVGANWQSASYTNTNTGSVFGLRLSVPPKRFKNAEKDSATRKLLLATIALLQNDVKDFSIAIAIRSPETHKNLPRNFARNRNQEHLGFWQVSVSLWSTDWLSLGSPLSLKCASTLTAACVRK